MKKPLIIKKLEIKYDLSLFNILKKGTIQGSLEDYRTLNEHETIQLGLLIGRIRQKK